MFKPDFAPDRVADYSGRLGGSPQPRRLRLGVRSLILSLVAIAGVIIGMQLRNDFARLRQQEAQIRIDNARLSQFHGKLNVVRRAAPQERHRLSANADGRARTALDVLTGLEAEWRDNISFLRIDGDVSQRRLRLQVLAKSREELFQFVQRLSTRFGENVFLERHSLMTTPRDGWLVNASMTVGWK